MYALRKVDYSEQYNNTEHTGIAGIAEIMIRKLVLRF